MILMFGGFRVLFWYANELMSIAPQVPLHRGEGLRSLLHLFDPCPASCLQLMKLATSKAKWRLRSDSKVLRSGLQFQGSMCRSSLTCMACCNIFNCLALSDANP